jgi:hypothetical protein
MHAWLCRGLGTPIPMCACVQISRRWGVGAETMLVPPGILYDEFLAFLVVQDK